MADVSDLPKKRSSRRFSRHRRNAAALGQQADQKIEKLLIRRFDRLASVRRFVALWILLFIALMFAGIYQFRNLSTYYQTLQPVPGGLYTEGLIGNFTNANPVYATGAADTAVSRLVFSGLFRYNNSNKLVGDLASGYSLNPTQTIYTVHLKENLKWHDGKPVTADDVVFTYKTIQNISAQSPLYSSWQSITVDKADNYTINFELPNALSAFPYSLTNGIIPAHLLKDIPAEQLRSAQFNTDPIGTGPFVWKFIEVIGSNSDTRQQRISLASFKNYQAGAPKLDGFNLISFTDDQQMLTAFNKKQISAMSGLETVPDKIATDKNLQIYVTPLTTAVMTFFNTTTPVLSDLNVRRALVLGTNRSQLNSLFEHPVLLVDGPLLKGQLGYDHKLVEPKYNPVAANALLEKNGWIKNADGIRQKGSQKLTFVLSAQDSPNYTKTAQFLQNQWSNLGVNLQVRYYDREELQASIVANHDYEALLYGIGEGVDPDVFAYWDSSQASITSQGHLNLSEYKSTPSDRAIEAARTRADPKVRAVKYKIFLAQWIKDLPAMGLYQPDYLYISRGPVFNYERKSANSGVDRFYNVHNWMVRQKHQGTN
jgi:peptide/nickel transport system substrate-binding protein